MLIINQDRDNAFTFTNENLVAVPVLGPSQHLLGFNLYMDGNPFSLSRNL